MQNLHKELLVYEPENISVYIHWSYCLKKCPYCDFNSFVSTTEINHKDWLIAYLNDINHQSQFLANKKIKTLFFGGGTPSLMTTDTVYNIIEAITKLNQGIAPQEITLEVNPSSFELEKFKEFKQAGVNRLSIGVQSFEEQQLKYLGRIHSSAEARNTIIKANEIFDRVSFDLINGLPNQSLEDWKQELTKAIPLIKSHVSIYELTIEQGTAFYAQKQKAVDENLGYEMFMLTSELLSKHGINRYEISNYAKFNEASQHNLNYWRGGLYLGVGPGAHGRVLNNKQQVVATMSHRNPKKWLNLATRQQEAFSDRTIISYKERLLELLLSNLRLCEAISGFIINNAKPQALNFLVSENLLFTKNQQFYITITGQLQINGIINYLAENLVI